MPVGGRDPRTFLSQPPSHQVSRTRVRAFPSPPQQTTQLAPQPAIQHFEHTPDLNVAEVVHPTPKDRCEFRDHTAQAVAASTPEDDLELRCKRARFRVLPPLPEAALCEALRYKLLDFLRTEGVLEAELADRMLNWRHSGFSVHNRVRTNAGDAAGRQRLARYMIRCPFALEKMRYVPDSGMVIYRSKPHATLKRKTAHACHQMAAAADEPHPRQA